MKRFDKRSPDNSQRHLKCPPSFGLTKADEKEIDAVVAERLREDAAIGRWVRAAFPNEHAKILEHARRELKFWRMMRERYDSRGVCRG